MPTNIVGEAPDGISVAEDSCVTWVTMSDSVCCVVCATYVTEEGSIRLVGERRGGLLTT